MLYTFLLIIMLSGEPTITSLAFKTMENCEKWERIFTKELTKLTVPFTVIQSCKAEEAH